MSFFVDIVSEDSFYENLTLGVTKLLEANTCVKNVQLERRGGCERTALSVWEQKHCCLLTENLRNFYMSTDGFLLTWSLDISGEEFPIGRMEIRALSSLKRYTGPGSSSGNNNKEQGDSSKVTSGDSEKPAVVEPTFGGSRCKLFELAECGGDCKILLAYQVQPDQDEPSVWLYNETSSRWHLLADCFVKYFRMMLVHLGLPLWQKCAAGLQLTPWIEQIYHLVGPHLLPSVTPAASAEETRLWNEGPTNLLDPSIFRTKEHHHVGGARQKGSSNANPAAGTATTTAPATSTTSNSRKKSGSH